MLATEPALNIGDGGDNPERWRRVLVSSLLDESHRFCIFLFLSLFIIYSRCRPAGAAGKRTAILTLQEAMDFVNTLHPGGIRSLCFDFVLCLTTCHASLAL